MAHPGPLHLPRRTLHEVIYENWLRGEFGKPDAPQATQFGRKLLDAQSWTVDDITNGKDADNNAEQAKKDQYKSIATQLGPATGYFKGTDGSRIGAGSVVVREVPENSVVVGVPGRVTFRDGARSGIDLNQSDLPDPLARTLEQMVERIHALEAEIESLRQALKETSRT